MRIPRFTARMLALLLAIGLSGCNLAQTATVPTATAPIVLAPTAAAPPTVLAPTSKPVPIATSEPAPTNVPATVAAPTADAAIAPLSQAAGQTVLQLAYGSGAGQIGRTADAAGTARLPTFRIGADGSIRVLDSVNRRVLFFAPDGGLRRSIAIPDAENPRDFIVTNKGELFVYDPDSMPPAILRYGANGALAERIEVNHSLIADGLMLSAEQEQNIPSEIVLTHGLDQYWTVRHLGENVSARLQPLTERPGTVSPRSPTPFVTTFDAARQPTLSYVALTASITGDALDQGTIGAVPLPDAQFFNVDRAMNLYVVRGLSEQQPDTIDVWRVRPTLADAPAAPLMVAGGARISVAGCQQPTWRTFYVDQAGAAWTLCANAQGVTVTTYRLADPQGQPLPAAALEAADVRWQPGSKFSAA